MIGYRCLRRGVVWNKHVRVVHYLGRCHTMYLNRHQGTGETRRWQEFWVSLDPAYPVPPPKAQFR